MGTRNRGITNKHLFEKLDKNKDGKVDKQEFRQTMLEFGLKAEEVTEDVIEEFFGEIDVRLHTWSCGMQATTPPGRHVR